jgi:hypothetical protein
VAVAAVLLLLLLMARPLRVMVMVVVMLTTVMAMLKVVREGGSMQLIVGLHSMRYCKDCPA